MRNKMPEEYDDGYADEDEEEEYKSQGIQEAPPQVSSGVIYRYQTEAEVPRKQQRQLGFFKMLMGRHVALGNTKRLDNPRHINSYEMSEGYMRNPLLRHRAVGIMGRTTAELQLCRSNERVGGFEREIQQSIVKREHYDIKETSTPMTAEKRKMFDRFRKNKQKEEG